MDITPRCIAKKLPDYFQRPDLGKFVSDYSVHEGRNKPGYFVDAQETSINLKQR